MSRLLLALIVLAATIGVVVAYKDPEQVARASDSVSNLLRKRATSSGRAVRSPAGRAAISRCRPKSTACPPRW